MTVTNAATPVIDINTIRSILYLGMKGGVALTTPAGPGSTRGPREARAPGPMPTAGVAPRAGVDTWA